MWYFFAILIVLLFLSIYFVLKYRKKVIDKVSLFLNELKKLRNGYITYSQKNNLINEYKNVFTYTPNIILGDKYVDAKKIYENLEKYVESYNNMYISNELISNKEYFDTLFEYPLDNEQRIAIVTDEDNSLIVAGAGSGKTSTMVAKAKYLIEKKNINPNEIIAISFTNNAVDNYKKRVGNNDIKSYTFHKLALKIISDYGSVPVIDTDLLISTTHKYITEGIFNNNSELKNMLELLFMYIHIPQNIEESLGEKIDYEKGFTAEDLLSIINKINYIKSLKKDPEELHKYVNFLKNNKNISPYLEPYLDNEEMLYEKIKELFKNHMLSLSGDKVKSQEELIIANYLYLHGIKYEYEKIYKYNDKDTNKKYTPDFYLPEYDIYLEHFGINEEGRTPQYTEIEEKKYLDEMLWKREIHQKNNTKLLETYSWQYRNGTIIKNLKELLINNGVKLKEIDYDKLYKDITEYYYSSEFNELEKLIIKFIKMFKSNNYNDNDFDKFINDSKNNVRSLYLLKIFKNVYNLYQKVLKESGKIDLEDLLNIANNIIKDGYYKEKVKYIIVDEYQDIALSRFELIKSIQDVTGCKIVAVGDDWQSIFRFSGCDLDMFVNFKKYLPYSKIMYINNTHRNSQQLINISGNFIMKNEKGQLRKNLKSNLTLKMPIKYFYYNNDVLKATKAAVDDLVEKGCKNIAILGRNNSDLRYYVKNYDNNKIIPYDLSNLFKSNVKFYTVHKSKGLEFDGVVLCNMKNGITGFPNKMADDPVLSYVTIGEDDYLYEEERRLFYVALTRTKTYCNILVPNFNASVFTKELMDDNLQDIDVYMVEDDEFKSNPICPKCQKGKLIIRINGKDNSEFVSCMNYPKCDYHSNHTDIINDPIKCYSCGGFLVKRSGTYGDFYGCTNYPYCHETLDIKK